MAYLTVDSICENIYHNLLTSLIQDIVSRITSAEQLLRSRYPNLKPYYYDPEGKLDVNGMLKQQDSSTYFRCNNCDREISANRFAAHLERCLGRGRRI